MRKTDRTYTYADYKTWPDDERWELIDGVAWNMSTVPNSFHQGISMELSYRIRRYIEGRPCRVFAAPFDVLLPEFPEQTEDESRNVVQPDVTVICNHDLITPRGCFGPPDWVVEILSPYTMKKDMNEKFRLFERSGIGEYWIVDPGGKSVQVFRLSGDGEYGDPEVYEEGTEISSGVLNGLVITVSDLFIEL